MRKICVSMLSTFDAWMAEYALILEQQCAYGGGHKTVVDIIQPTYPCPAAQVCV